jgi:hypothetical protein
MFFDSLDAVREIAGEDYDTAVVTGKARGSSLALTFARSIMIFGRYRLLCDVSF